MSVARPGAFGALAADVRGLPRGAWIIYAGTFINRFGSFVLTFLVLVLTQRGFSPAQAGMAAAAYGVGSLGAGIVGGQLADRIGRRRTIVLSMFSSAAVLVGLWQAQGLALTIALAALSGVTAEMYRPASAALLADVTPPGRRVSTFAMYRMSINLGYAMGPAAAGFFATRYPGVVFLGDAATSLLFGILVLFAVPRSADDVARKARAAAMTAPRVSLIPRILADHPFLVILAASLVSHVVYHQDIAVLPLEVRARGFPAQAYGVMMSLNGLTCLLLELPVASITSRLPPWLPMSTGVALMGVGLALTAVAPGLPWLMATVVVWTLGEIVWAPVSAAYVADLAPREVQGRYQSVFGLTSAAGLVVAPAVGPALYAWSPGTLWTLCAVLGLCAAALCATLRRPRTVVEAVPVS
ncbi:MAG TPA: MFS transporter [Longimicrobium sp.]|nr:MFS transporter [Longimicrobium sp.]